MTTIDIDALKQKYAQERAKRLRPDGNDQYIELKDQFGHYLDDPYIAVVDREPVRDHVTFAFIGGGFAGLLAGARVKEAGVEDVRIIDKAGDFGGTWYWNRYPGAQCDTASFVYMPLLEETGHMPSEKYAHAPEILEHCQRIGKQYGLYDHALFHTQVTHLEWDDDNSRWIVRTNRGDEFTAQFVGMGTGPLHVPKLPGIPGVESFQGHSFHTSRWDYGYTGGDPSTPMDKLADKRVAIIGTGATAVQCIPHLARACGELFVFQRTPSSIDVRDNRPTDAEWFAEMATPGWQQRWLENFTANQTPGAWPPEDLVQDGWTDLSRRIRDAIMAVPPDQLTPENMLGAFDKYDFEKMSEIRARVDTIVEDPEAAQNLKAWYRQLCKRPCFHDEYLQSFNTSGTHLIDTAGKGVERITENGVVVAGVEYPVDCVIYSTGFEVGTPHTRRAGYDMTGRSGVTLSEYWGDGMRTLHGLTVHGFPNAFIMQLSQGAALISNVPHNFTEAGHTIGAIVKHALEYGYDVVEPTKAAEDAWVKTVLSGGMGPALANADCTPGYYNNEGRPGGPGTEFFVGYPGGALAFFGLIKQWRESGEFEGLEFR
ncbi:MAG: NAD(P)/FAD-dependent oxidoreductase [Actinomycetota bacterium]|nr:NAD(P)/FAD-dependent oxidoreductase [Actinomycetota bacterium]